MEAPRIVVGIDGSEGSKAALEWAIREGSARGATVDVVICWSVGALPRRRTWRRTRRRETTRRPCWIGCSRRSKLSAQKSRLTLDRWLSRDIRRACCQKRRWAPSCWSSVREDTARSLGACSVRSASPLPAEHLARWLSCPTQVKLSNGR